MSKSRIDRQFISEYMNN